MSYELKLVFWMRLHQAPDVRKDGGTSIEPREEEAGVHGTVLTRHSGGIGREGLWGGGQVDDGIGERVGASEGEQNSTWGCGGRRGQGEVAAGVGEKGSGVPCLQVKG
jgi:hypothetical protein